MFEPTKEQLATLTDFDLDYLFQKKVRRHIKEIVVTIFCNEYLEKFFAEEN